MITTCPICYNDFTWNPSACDKTRLPVQSQQCPHLLCWGCLMELHVRAKQRSMEYSVVALPCPECRTEDAYGPSNPIVSLAVCHALQERHALLDKLQRYHRRQQRQRGGQPPSLMIILDELWHEVLHPRHLWDWAERRGLVPPPNCTRVDVWMTRNASLAVLWGSSLCWGPRIGPRR